MEIETYLRRSYLEKPHDRQNPLGTGQPAPPFADEDGIDLGGQVRRVRKSANSRHRRLRYASSEDREIDKPAFRARVALGVRATRLTDNNHVVKCVQAVSLTLPPLSDCFNKFQEINMKLRMEVKSDRKCPIQMNCHKNAGNVPN